MSSKKRRNGICAYCGTKGLITDDHIPPKSLFPEDDRKNLIKVPACRTCNNRASKDDEYFRLVMTLREDVSDNPEAKKVLQIAMRSLRKPEALKFRANFLKGLHRIQPRTPSGLILPTKGAYKLDIDRVERTIARITRGLFYDLKKCRLPDDYHVSVFGSYKMKKLSNGDIEQFTSQILEPLGRQTGIMVGRNVFLYKFLFTDSDPNLSIWLFLFYGTIVFFALIDKASQTGQ